MTGQIGHENKKSVRHLRVHESLRENRFQLYARLDGQRFRKNFPTRTEAEAERQVQEVNWLQRDTGTRAAITRLTEDQLHEAETVYRTRDVRAHLETLRLQISSLDFRRFCKRHGIRRDGRAGRPRVRVTAQAAR